MLKILQREHKNITHTNLAHQYKTFSTNSKLKKTLPSPSTQNSQR
jgi:hypothetical protein